MKVYKPKFSELSSIVFVFVISLACFIGTCIGFKIRFSADSQAMFALLIITDLFFLSISIYVGISVLFLSAKIEIDSLGVTRRSFRGTERVLWNEIESFSTYKISYESIDLYRKDGTRFVLIPSVYTSGDELEAKIYEGLAPVRTKMLERWRNEGATLKKPLMATFIGLAALIWMAGIFCCSAVLALYQDLGVSGSNLFQSIGAGIFLAFGALLIWLLLYALSHRIEISKSGIAIKSLNFQKTIPFDEIQSITTKEVVTKDTSIQITTVCGKDNKKISLSLAIPNYLMILELLREKAVNTTPEGDLNELKAAEVKQKKIGNGVLLVAAPICVAMMFLLPLLTQTKYQERLDKYMETGRKGVAAEATVLSKSTASGKKTEYLLVYSFTPKGKSMPVKSSSPVKYSAWERTRIGDKLTALYIPGEPAKCRLTISQAGEIAKGGMRVNYFYFGTGVFSAFYFGYLFYAQFKRRKGEWKEPEIPQKAVALRYDQLKKIRKELKKISYARAIGIWVGLGGFVVMIVGAFAMLCVMQYVPALKTMMDSQEGANPATVGLIALLAIPMAGMFILWPFGEFYAYVRTRNFEEEMSDPRLAGEVVSALQSSVLYSKQLSGEASIRLLNALTAALATPDSVDLSPNQRSFLYGYLKKWQNVEAPQPFCAALIRAVTSWKDPIGIAAVRDISKTANLPEVREAVNACLSEVS